MKVDGVKGFPPWTSQRAMAEGAEGQGKVRPIGQEVAVSKRENGLRSKPSKPQEALESGELERLKKAKKEVLKLKELLRERIEGFLERYDLALRYTVDQQSRSIVTQILERRSGRLIRQIPSEEALRIKQALEEFLDQIKGGEER